jgi:phosphatidylserine decarboxylase
MVKVHKEGRGILRTFGVIGIIFLIIIYIGFSSDLVILIPLILVFIALFIFIARFFRIPDRKTDYDNSLFYSPADGKVVVIEETTENEYFKDSRLQVSVFMSIWDVHINYFPFRGKVVHYKYHPGQFLPAIHPKSSTLNERNTIVIENERNIQVLVRQIAGVVARRIVCYAEPGSTVEPGTELGVIKFGSRVDIFLPPGTEILVRPGQQVYGARTPLARISHA